MPVDTVTQKVQFPFTLVQEPFAPIQTKVPGTIICEHLPKQAAMMDKFTLIRSADPAHSNHEPNMV